VIGTASRALSARKARVGVLVCVAVGLAAVPFAAAGGSRLAGSGVPVGSVAYTLTFAGEKPPGGWIEAASLDGSDRRVLTPPPQVGDRRADQVLAWSPDGTKLALIRSGVPSAHAGLYVVDSDGTGLHAVVLNGRGGFGANALQDAAWSPDGTKLALTRSGRRGQSGLYVVNSDGSGLHQVLSGSGVYGAVWSSDGSHIASWSSGNECDYPAGGKEPRLWISSVDGSAAVELPPLIRSDKHVADNGGVVRWSSDGHDLLYSIDQYGGRGDCRGITFAGSVAYTIGTDGHSRHQLSDAGTLMDAAWAKKSPTVALLYDDGVYTQTLAKPRQLVLPISNADPTDPYSLAWATAQDLVFSSPAGLKVVDVLTRKARVILPASKQEPISLLEAVSSDGTYAAGTLLDQGDFVVSIDGTKRWPIAQSAGTVPHAVVANTTIYLK
jgi:hypothetical protein